MKLSQKEMSVMLSVIVPAHNAEKYVGRCLDALLLQDVERYEIICVENGSTDGTLDVLRRNEAKHQMREIRQSKRLESDVSHIYEIDIGESLENEEIEMYLKKFLLNLKPVQKRRFKMYYIDNLTYRQIADIESRNIKSIYESVQAGKKKFLKYLDKHPNKNTPTSLSL